MSIESDLINLVFDIKDKLSDKEYKDIVEKIAEKVKERARIWVNVQYEYLTLEVDLDDLEDDVVNYKYTNSFSKVDRFKYEIEDDDPLYEDAKTYLNKNEMMSMFTVDLSLYRPGGLREQLVHHKGEFQTEDLIFLLTKHGKDVYYPKHILKTFINFECN